MSSTGYEAYSEPPLPFPESYWTPLDGGCVPEPPPPLPRELLDAAGWRGASQALHTLVDTISSQVGLTSVPSISPTNTVTPYPTSHSPAMVRMGRNGLIQQKPSQKRLKIIFSEGYHFCLRKSTNRTTPLLLC